MMCLPDVAAPVGRVPARPRSHERGYNDLTKRRGASDVAAFVRRWPIHLPIDRPVIVRKLRCVDLPESVPERILSKREIGIPGNHRAGKSPLALFRDQLGPDRVFRDVAGYPLKGIAGPVLLPQHVVVRLLLPAIASLLQRGVGVLAKKANQVSLLTFPGPAQQQEVTVIRHQAVDRAHGLVPRQRMQQ